MNDLLIKLIKYISLFTLFISCSVNIQGQEKSKVDTSYIKSYYDKLILKGFTKVITNRLSQEYQANEHILRYRTNSNLKLGVGINWKWLSLSMSLISPLKKLDINDKGKTEGVDFQTNVYFEKFGFDFHLQRNKGYFLDYPNLLEDQKYIVRPDMDIFSLGGDFFFVYNHEEFSYRAAFQQTSRQLKSAGSFLFGFKTGINHVASDSIWIPTQLEETIPLSSGAKKISSFNMGVGVGYAYTKLLKRNLFITLSGLPSFNLQVAGFTMENPDHNTAGVNGFIKIQWRGAFGYNTDEYYAGLNFVSHNVLLGKYINNKYSYRFGHVRFIVAKRF